jgi:hypothetical protein
VSHASSRDAGAHGVTTGQMVNREKAQTALARLLLERIRRDNYPSATHMAMLEQTIPPDLLGEYLTVLLTKVADDQWPSIPMLRRIQRITSSL